MSFNSGSKSKETQESWESLLKKSMLKDGLFQLSRPAESRIQWIHLLDPFDQHDTDRVLKSAKVEDVKKSGVASSGTKSSLRNQAPGDKLAPLKIPEAVVALAQAAAKASGESLVGGSMDLPVWPLIPFSKVQTIKCEKCHVEFCSPLNHRRHLRMMHRRPVNVEKEGTEILKQKLAIFWDNLCPEDAYKVVACKNLVMEDLTGDKVVRALSQLLQQATLFVLPSSYVKAGAMLLELVQSRSSRLFHTSSELFKILDGSSEKTFPTPGLSAMQRYVFEGGAGKFGLEVKNLVASLGFLVEYNLVKAFIKNKDEEALRCQTALVEEEEASLRKQAELQEKRRMKKVRQRKDSKDKEQKLTKLVTESDSDASDGEIVTTNASENLYNRLTGDTEQQEDYTTTDVSEEIPIADHPSEKGRKNGEVCALESKGQKLVLENPKIASVQSGGSGPTGGSIAQNSLIVQKQKYTADRALPFKEKKVPVVRVRQSWKERHIVDGRKLFFKCPSVDSTEKEQAGKAFEVPLTSPDPSDSPRMSVVVDSSGSPRMSVVVDSPGSPRMSVVVDSPGTTFQACGPKKYFIRPAKVRHNSGMRHAIWTKVSKNASDERTKECLDTSLQGRGSAEVSGTAMLEVDCVPISAPFSNASILKKWIPDNNDDMNCQVLKSVPAGSSVYIEQVPVSPGQSVVIGSVSVPLVEPSQLLRPSKCPTVVTRVDEAVNRVSPVEEPHPAGSEAMFRDLQENGFLKCVTQKEPEKEGKTSKALSHDPEGKENKRVCEIQIRQDISPAAATAVPGGGFSCGKLKIWRPVGSHSYHERGLGCSPSAVGRNCTQENNALASGEEVTNAEERVCFISEEGDPIPSLAVDMDQPSMQVGESVPTGLPCNGSGFRSSSSTYKSIASLLSHRWSDAVNDPDSVILSFDDGECHPSERTIDPPRTHMASRLRPEARPFIGRRRWQHGSGKQGYFGGHISSNRPLTSTDHLHATFRCSGFRYVPK